MTLNDDHISLSLNLTDSGGVWLHASLSVWLMSNPAKSIVLYIGIGGTLSFFFMFKKGEGRVIKKPVMTNISLAHEKKKIRILLPTLCLCYTCIKPLLSLSYTSVIPQLSLSYLSVISQLYLSYLYSVIVP